MGYGPRSFCWKAEADFRITLAPAAATGQAICRTGSEKKALEISEPILPAGGLAVAGRRNANVKCAGGLRTDTMTEQNRRYIMKEIGKLLSEIWQIRAMAEQEYGPAHPITKKLSSMHSDAQSLLREK